MPDTPVHSNRDAVRPGIALELVRSIVARAGIEIDERFVPWARAMNSTEKTPNSLIIPLSRLPSRESRFVWIKKLYTMKNGFITLDQPINSLDKARSLDRVGVWRATSMEEELKQLGFTNFIAISDELALARMLIKGRIQAWYGQFGLAKYSMRKEIEAVRKRFRFSKAFNFDPVWLAGNLNLPVEFVEKLQGAYDSMQRDQTANTIRKKYGF